jgi:DNA-binding phage protein
MFEDAINALLAGELDEGHLLLRQYVNATIGFGELARRTGKADKNLIRALGLNGSPTAANLFQINPGVHEGRRRHRRRACRSQG